MNPSTLGDCFVCLLNPVWQTVLTRSLWHPGRRSLEHAWSSLPSAARDQLMDHRGRISCILFTGCCARMHQLKPVVPTSVEVTLWTCGQPVLRHPAGSPSISLCAASGFPTDPPAATHSRHRVGTPGLVMAPTPPEADRILAQTLAVPHFSARL